MNKPFFKYWDSYQDYLESDHWRGLRARKLDQTPRCEQCGRAKRVTLQIHHLTYERFPDCPLSDLQTLCRRCHEMVHGINGKPVMEQRPSVDSTHQPQKTCGNAHYTLIHRDGRREEVWYWMTKRHSAHKKKKQRRLKKKQLQRIEKETKEGRANWEWIRERGHI